MLAGKQGKQPAGGFAAGSCLPPHPEGPSIPGFPSTLGDTDGVGTSGAVSSQPLAPSTCPKWRTRGTACHNGCNLTMIDPVSSHFPWLDNIRKFRGFTEPQALKPVLSVTATAV